MNPDSGSDANVEATSGNASSEGTAAGQPAEVQRKVRAPSRTPPTSGWRYTFSSLANRDFRFLWLGMFFMMGGLQMEGLVIGYLVYDLTGSPFLLGLVEAGSGVSILVFVLFAGAIADRVERKLMIQAGQGAAAVSALVIGTLIAAGSITWLYLLAAAVFQGIFFAFLMPARYAIVPQMVGPDKISNALALNAAAMSITALTAPAVAGTLYGLIGPHRVYFVIAAMELIAFALTGSLPRTRPDSKASHDSIAKEITAGLSHIWHSPLLLVLLVMGLSASLLVFPFRVMLPVFVVDLYGRGPESMGLLLMMMGAGALAGSLFIASLGRGKRGLVLIIGSFLSGGALLFASLIPIYFAALGIMVMLGLGDSGRRALNQALMMEQVDDKFRGRVISVFTMTFGLMPLGVLPAGIIAEFYGAQVAVGVLAGLMLATTSAVFLTQKRLRDLP